MLKVQPIVFDYVLVVEFLEKDDVKTGTDLVNKWNKRYPRKLMKLKTCNRSGEVLEAISSAANTIKTKGIPLVHIESHGSNWYKDEYPPKALVGIKDDHISWDLIWNELRVLNILSEFNLLIVAATCFGAETQRGIVQGLCNGLSGSDVQPLPFMASVGFDESVPFDVLFTKIFNFYEKLLVENRTLDIAVQEANLSIGHQAALVSSWSINALNSAISEFKEQPLKNNEYFWKKHCEDFPEHKIEKNKVLEDVNAFIEPALNKVISDVLCFQKFPCNREKFLI